MFKRSAMVLVDTSVWIEASRRDGNLAYKVDLENLLDEYEAAWCSPVKLEFIGGARKEDRKKLEFWFECIPFRAVEERHWELAKLNAWKLCGCGLTLPWNNILIASMPTCAPMRKISTSTAWHRCWDFDSISLATAGVMNLKFN